MAHGLKRRYVACFLAFMINRLLLCFVLATAGSLRAESPVPAGPVTKGQRLFFCGHSFHFYVPAMLDEIVRSTPLGDEVIVGRSMIGGSKVIQHWNAKGGKNEARASLEVGAVDVQTMTPIYLPDAGLENFATLGLAHNPGYRATVQELWLPYDEYQPHFYDPPRVPKPVTIDHNASSAASLRASHEKYFKEMDDHVSTINTKLGRQVLFVVPAGQAVIALREKIIAGQAPGLQAQADLFTDALGHPAPPLQALVTYCHYAVIYRQSPVGLPVPAALAKSRFAGSNLPALNQLLQELAWETVTHHPLSGVTGS